MKKTLLLTIFTLVSFLAITVIVSCTKEGPKGEPGINGTDGTAVCGTCHNMTEDLIARIFQWEASTHATGGNFERNSNSCAPCHTSDGFREVIQTGADTTAATVNNPTPPNCYTCHEIHETYTATDWALRISGAVTFWNNPTVSFDAGNGSICLQCHQMRIVSPAVDPATPTATVDMTNKRWGGHHGPQGNIFAGTGGYEYTSGTYNNSMHTTLVTNGCAECHMGDPYGTQAGGHQMGVTYEYHGHDAYLLSGCITCHTDEDALELKIADTRAIIDTLLSQLKTELELAGIYDAGYLAVPATYTMDQAGAYLNYQIVLEDRSAGAHNYAYARALLENSIAALKKY